MARPGHLVAAGPVEATNGKEKITFNPL